MLTLKMNCGDTLNIANVKNAPTKEQSRTGFCEQLQPSEEVFECCIRGFSPPICVGNRGRARLLHRAGASGAESMLLFVSVLLEPQGLSFRTGAFSLT